jgi:general secretion pathway protein E
VIARLFEQLQYIQGANAFRDKQRSPHYLPQVNDLASLPGKPELYAKLLYVLQAPMQQLVTVLSAVPSATFPLTQVQITTNVMTVEDPIEYDLEGVGQTQVNPRIDMTFAKALRSILRQDPDVIMIGEIRDLETAQIAVQASLTGHLVLATLHTNDAVSAITRLIDMGVEPFLLSSSLLGVCAQRLVRRLCQACREPDPVAPGTWRAVGCAACARTGFQGRTGIYELLVVDDALRQRIHERAAEGQIRAEAQALGMMTMREDGQRWVTAGLTSLDEVIRVTRD